MADQADDDLYFPPTKPKWKRRLLLAVVVLLVLVTGAEVFVSTKIASKLKYTISNKLDAELQTQAVLYVPPYGVMIVNPQLNRGRETLFKASSLRLNLASFPKKDQPLVISSLRVDGPAVYLKPDSFREIQKPGGKHLEPKKLSDMLRLNNVRIIEGSVQWTDPARPGVPPMKWEGITLNVDTVQQSTSRYTLALTARAQRSADANAVGSIDVDSLQLDLRNLTVTANAEPEPIRSPLPQVVQAFLKTYSISGKLNVTASGTIPLREPTQGSFNAKVTLERAMASFDEAKIFVNRGGAELAVAKRAGTPLVVEMKKIELGTSGENGAARAATVNKGVLTLDAEKGTWALADVEGFIAMEKSGFAVPSSIAPTTTPVDVPTYERFRPSGRMDFAIVASAPFKFSGKPWESIDHEIIFFPRGASFRPKGFARNIEDIVGEIRVKGGMIIFQELKGRYGNDEIRLRAARLPIDGLPKVQKWQEISGSVTFTRPLQAYSKSLDDVFENLNPEGPFLVAGSFMVDKSDATTRSSKSYDLIVSSDKGTLRLTPYGVPLTKVRGDATVTPAGVQLHEATAEVLGGTMSATGQWMRTAADAWAYDGEMTMHDADLAKLKELADKSPDAKLRGKLSARASFLGLRLKDESASTALKQLRASGEAEIIQGEFFHLPVLRDIMGAVHLKEAATVGDGAALFEIADNVVTLRDAGVNAPVLGLQGGGKVGFDGAVEANVVAAPLADWKEKLRETKIPIVSDVAGEIAGTIQKFLNSATGKLLYQFRVTGNVKDKVEVTTVPTPVLTDAGATVFGRMLKPRRDQRPLDWFKRDETK